MRYASGWLMRYGTRGLAATVAVLAVGGCGGPDTASLRESFAQQLESNRFVKEFQRDGDDLLFTAPGAEGGVAKWRVHIDSATIEGNDDSRAAATQPYKGIVKSSWYSEGQIVRPSGGQSNLPLELMSNGLSQDCWAFWEDATKRWSWE
jgi:hypothetical protein